MTTLVREALCPCYRLWTARATEATHLIQHCISSSASLVHRYAVILLGVPTKCRANTITLVVRPSIINNAAFGLVDVAQSNYARSAKRIGLTQRRRFSGAFIERSSHCFASFQTLVVALVVVAIYEGPDLTFENARQIVMFQALGFSSSDAIARSCPAFAPLRRCKHRLPGNR
jgi:hypothetical protein